MVVVRDFVNDGHDFINDNPPAAHVNTIGYPAAIQVNHCMRDAVVTFFLECHAEFLPSRTEYLGFLLSKGASEASFDALQPRLDRRRHHRRHSCMHLVDILLVFAKEEEESKEEEDSQQLLRKEPMTMIAATMGALMILKFATKEER